MLGHLFAMIGTCSSLCSPLLLEEGNSCARCVLRLEILEVVDVKRVPGLTYALRLYQLLVNWNGAGANIQLVLDQEAPSWAAFEALLWTWMVDECQIKKVD